MTSTHHLDAGRTTETKVGPIAAAAVLGALALNAIGIFGDGTPGQDPDLGAFFAVCGFIVVAAAIVFGWAVPRYLDRPKAAGVGLGLSIAALVLVVAFWAGLTPILGAGGLVLGLAARARGRGGMATAAIALGALALVGDVAIYIADWMSTNNIAGM